MRLVHLSDLHLGYRQYQRLTPGGINQREADVATTFRVAIDRVIALRPEVVVVAGDVFHNVRPSNQAILHAFLQFGRLRAALPNAHIVIVAGNHDTPRTTEAGGILQLFGQLGLEVVDREPRRLTFNGGDLAVFAVPDVPGLPRPSLLPDPAARYNVLVFHGGIEGALPSINAFANRPAVEFSLSDITPSRWDYVAMGDCHVHREIAPNAYYSGSIDYTSVDVWGELKEERQAGLIGKGLVEYDLASRHLTFHPLPAARPIVDLAPINATGLTAAEVDARIRIAIDDCDGGIDEKIVRLIVRDLPRHTARELDHKAIREYKRTALNFHLDLRRPEPETLRLHGTGAPGRRPSLDDIVREKLAMRPVDADIDRALLVKRALDYLEQAEQVAAPPALVEL